MNKNKIDLRPGPRLHPNGLINNLKLLLYYGIPDSINVIHILYSTFLQNSNSLFILKSVVLCSETTPMLDEKRLRVTCGSPYIHIKEKIYRRFIKVGQNVGVRRDVRTNMHRSHSRPSIEMCTLPNGNGIKFPGQSRITGCFANLDTQLFMISIRKAIYERQEQA
ncbi:hypothetical protein HZH68_005183 [Vespula germanica]|uniref:Uncharacterized protein n=1 Tax=Vespula germanica TaxID=30212 RepID=A0A834NF70_VESGE|nr:hypothetical protein HZH68_005183 [Vespula germanica]